MHRNRALARDRYVDSHTMGLIDLGFGSVGLICPNMPVSRVELHLSWDGKDLKHHKIC